MVYTVKVKDLSLRHDSKQLAKELEDNEVVDMENVEFITRSAGDELLCFEREKDLEFENLQEEVRVVLESVQESIDEQEENNQ